MKGNFIRKCKNITEYEKLLNSDSNLFKEYYFEIVKTIKLSRKDFEILIHNFMNEYSLFKNHVKLMKINNDDVLKCLEVYSDNYKFRLIVYSAGYHYPRYIHIKYL